jgi:hypothetical protein
VGGYLDASFPELSYSLEMWVSAGVGWPPTPEVPKTSCSMNPLWDGCAPQEILVVRGDEDEGEGCCHLQGKIHPRLL